MRFNIFRELHTPARTALLNTCMALEAAQYDMEKIPAAARRATEVIAIVKELIRNEELHLFPLLFQFEPSVWDEFIRQHHKVKNGLRSLEDALDDLLNATSQEYQVFYQVEVEHAFNKFLSICFTHMDEEEEVINEILWRYYSDDTLVEICQQVKHQHGVLTIGSTVSMRRATAA